MTTASDVLTLTADYIEEHGWTQGTFMNGDGAVCLLGALGEVTGDLGGDRRTDLFSDAAEMIRRRIGESLVVWNDDDDRTQGEVIDLLRSLAEARNEH